MENLRHIITEESVYADPNKISCMINWPKPTNVKGLRGFLELTGYYRMFVKNYGEISRPLTKLLQKDQFNSVVRRSFYRISQAEAGFEHYTSTGITRF